MIKFLKKYSTVIFYVLFSCIGLLNFLEAVKFPGLIASYLFFSPTFFLGLILGLALVLKFLNLIQVQPILFRLFSLLAVATYATAMILGLAELNQYDNFVFSTYAIYYPQIGLLFVLSLIGTLINISNQIYKKYYRYFLFLLPLILIVIGSVFWTWPMDFFITLNKEDHFIEYLTAINFFLAAGSSAALVINQIKQKHWFNSFLLVLASCVLFFIAGEEISWGQRLLSYQVGDQLLETNRQTELTFHNSPGLREYIYQSYLALGIYGSISWILLRLNLKLKLIKFRTAKIVFVPWSLSLFFFQNLFYNLSQEYGHIKFFVWSETSELLLSLGILIHLIQQYARRTSLKS